MLFSRKSRNQTTIEFSIDALELAAISPLTINLTSFSDILVEDSVRNIEDDNSTFANMDPVDLFVDLESEFKVEED